MRLEEKEENEEIRLTFTGLSPRERELRGKALLGLVLNEKHYSVAEHPLATFSRRDRKPLPLFSFEVGDMVCLKPSSGDAESYPSATVFEKDAERLTVAFNSEPPDWVEEQGAYELHAATNRATYKRMLEALEAVEETENTRLAFFRDVSTGDKEPSAGRPSLADADYLDPGLNASQKEAVRRASAAPDIALVHGPPGTGKTRVLVEIVRQAIRKKQSVFVAAPSNTACDNVLERLLAARVHALRLGHPARISEELRTHTLDYKLALHPSAHDLAARQAELGRLLKRRERYRDRRSPGRDAERELRSEISLATQEIAHLKREIFTLVMKETQVFVGTPAGIRDRSIREKMFDLLVLDEATQATEPVSWIPISQAKKVVMAGDHFQLPPTVRSKEADRQGLGISLFERFYEVLPPGLRVLLDRQYRMNEKIMGFSSKMFYEDRLIADESVKNWTLSGLKGVADTAATREPFLFIDTSGKEFEERLEPGSESRYNPEEADLVLSELSKMLEAGVPPAEIAVISPYSAQVRLLSSRTPDPAVEIDSVDGFQGREKELVIVSLVRSNMAGEMGFLADTRRMNVAMTRARRKLLVIGDGATLSTIPFYKKFIDYAESIGGYKTAWEL